MQSAAAKDPEVPRSANKDFLRALEKTTALLRDPARTLSTIVDELAEQYGNAPALISNVESYSFVDLSRQSWCYAHWGRMQGLEKGSVVALIMENCAEYIAIWLGLNRIGVVVALLNHNLVGTALRRCVDAVKPRRIIASSPFVDRCREALEESEIAIDDAARLKNIVARLSGFPLKLDIDQKPLLSEHALYIYTSGTSGFPKAAIITHRRLLAWGAWFCGLADIGATDRMFNCLPLYHSVGGIVAVWSTLLGGGSVVIRERFSASSFWSDIVANDCTLFQYIGELCRYLTKTPPADLAQNHRLRLAMGNGLRADVWQDFKERFGIPRIIEFYAATESNFSLYNVEGEPGAVGRVPSFLGARQKLHIIRVGADGEPLRTADGCCQICDVGEAGEVIAQILDKGGEFAFDGYLDRISTEKKTAKNVLVNGDAWMRSGDLMRKDARGFFYFVDRLGETFRWKGENVATAEVESVLAEIESVRDVAVYGVQIPGHDGRAGMAALIVDERFDLGMFRSHVDRHLPPYARPLFFRFVDRLEMTETFKHKKAALSNEGFDPQIVSDPLYLRTTSESYLPLDTKLYDQLLAGQIAL